MLPTVFAVSASVVLVTVFVMVLKRRARISEGLAPGPGWPLVLSVVLVLLLARLFAWSLFVQARAGSKSQLLRLHIQSDSMAPTIKNNEWVMVNLNTFSRRDPRPEEIVLFTPPEAFFKDAGARNNGMIVKRVVAVPGDEICIEPGYVAVDGRKLDRVYLRTIFASIGSTSRIGLPVLRTDSPSDEKGGSGVASALLTSEPTRQSDGSYTAAGIRFSACTDGPAVLLWRLGVTVNGRWFSRASVSELLGKGRVVLHPGKVYRNGKPLDEGYLAEDPEQAYPLVGGGLVGLDERVAQSVKQAVEKGDLKLIRDGGRLRVKLMPRKYFVMGDNCNNSSDSRYWGPIDRSAIRGVVLTTSSAELAAQDRQ